MRFGAPIGSWGRRKNTLRWIREVLGKKRVRKRSWSESGVNVLFSFVSSREGDGPDESERMRGKPCGCARATASSPLHVFRSL